MWTTQSTTNRWKTKHKTYLSGGYFPFYHAPMARNWRAEKIVNGSARFLFSLRVSQVSQGQALQILQRRDCERVYLLDDRPSSRHAQDVVVTREHPRRVCGVVVVRS